LREDKEMIYLYGVRRRREPIRELVATFDEVQDAEDYVRDSMLAAAKKPYFYPDPLSGKFTYKKDSLLRDYETCEVEDDEAEGITPHNPTV
jgi:hypothetical protein